MKFRIFRDFPQLRYGVSEKRDGSMKATANPEEDTVIQENRRQFFQNHGIDGSKIFTPHLTHSGNVEVITEDNFHGRFKADGFLTTAPGIALTITVADCFPLYFYDPPGRVIGLVHAGWRGIVKNIVGNTIQKFKDAFGSNPNDILLGIGPGIQKCHFTVKSDIINLFSKKFVRGGGDLYNVDLESIIMEQVRDKGIDKIESSGECTYCLSDKYFSYRRDKSEPLETMVAYIYLRN